MSWKLRPKSTQSTGANHNCNNAEGFTIAINHSGKFVSVGRNVYCGGSIDFIDNCEADFISMVEIMSMVKDIDLDNVGKIFYSKRGMGDCSDLSLLENDLDAMNLVQWLDSDRVISLFVEHEPLICSGNQSELPNVDEPLPFVGNLESSEERISHENAFVGSNENQSCGLSRTYLQDVVDDRETDESDSDKNHNVRGCPSKKNENNQKENERNEPSQASAQQMGPASVGHDQMGSASVGHDQMGSDQMDPDQMDPDQMGFDQMGHDQMGPQQMGSDQMGPQQMDNDPGLDEIYSVIDEFDAFDASLPNNEQPLARPPQSKRSNTSEKKKAMKTTQSRERTTRSANTSIETSQTLIKKTREVSTQKELAKSITVTGPTTRSKKNINSTSTTNSKASKSIDKVTGTEKIVHTQNSQTTKDVQSTKKTLGLKRKLDVRKMSQSQGQPSNSAPEVDKPIWRPPGRPVTDVSSFSRMFGGGYMISGGGIVVRPDQSIVRSEGNVRSEGAVRSEANVRSEGAVRSEKIVRSEEEVPICKQQ
ncbi:glutamyl-tRNA(Gln) amidotransferase subunit B [Striga asiatica]|uniref:Glutamyl-tRNA(Gln) amidotransferase subunit B n=1 Tax=Striga asiatica TaxID=4170 RepID=A0A5A7QXV0_STRAF|nr:glutamyl-tRNA(Gln) amidotransferase subunit B [Striga asiatica]